MRTKFLLSAVALTATFAACNNENVPSGVENNLPANQEIVGATLVSEGGSISLGGVESRVNANGWETSDKLALAWYNLTGTSGKITDDQLKLDWTGLGNDKAVYANHLFTRSEEGKFVTNSNIYQGAHFIYFPYTYSGKPGVMSVNVNAEAQTTDYTSDVLNKALYVSAQDFISASEVDAKTGKLAKDFYITPAVNTLKVNVTPEAGIASNSFLKNLEISKLHIWNQEALFKVAATINPNRVPKVQIDAEGEVSVENTYKALKENLANAFEGTSDSELTTNIDADITLANAASLRAFTLPTAVATIPAKWTEIAVHVKANGAEEGVSYDLGYFRLYVKDATYANENNQKALKKLQEALYDNTKAYYLGKNINNESNLNAVGLNIDLLASEFVADYNISNLEEWNLTVAMVDAFNSLSTTKVKPTFNLTGAVCVTEGETINVPAAGLAVETIATGAKVCFETDYTVNTALANVFSKEDKVVIEDDVTLTIEDNVVLNATVTNEGIINVGYKAQLGNKTDANVINNGRINVVYGSYVYTSTNGVIAFEVSTNTPAYEIDNLINADVRFTTYTGQALVNTLVVNANNVLDLMKVDNTASSIDPYTGTVVTGGAAMPNLKDIDIEMNGGTIVSEQEFTKSVKSISVLSGVNSINDVNIMTDLVVKVGAEATLNATEHLHGTTPVKHNMIINGDIDNEGKLIANTTVNTENIDNEKGNIIVNAGNTIWYTGDYAQGGKAEGRIYETANGVSIIPVTLTGNNTPAQNKAEAVAALNTAGEGSVVYLPEATYAFDGAQYNFGGTSEMSKPVSVVGDGNTVITGSTAKVFYFTLSDNSKDLVLKNFTINNSYTGTTNNPNDIWISPRGCSEDAIVNIVIENVTCKSLMLECAYVDGVTYNVELINCDIDQVNAHAFKGADYTTHVNVTYDDACHVNIVKGGSAPENVTVTKK